MIGRTISHYKILEHLGGGGMGVVYKAEDTRLKRAVALKFLPLELTRDPEAKQRFIHEAQAASSLDHPNICDIHDVGETEDGQLFIVMTNYEGETLKKKLAHGAVEIGEAVEIAIQVARGLAKAHEQGIIHRDIKPANLIITKENVVKILDFGLAKLSAATKLTRTGSTAGTIAYMSPQQAQGADADHGADIWSLGVVLYEMITGVLPFKGDVEQVVLYKIMNEDPAPAGKLRAGIPGALERVVDKALAKRPVKRYQNAREMYVALESLRSEMEAGTAKPGGFRFRIPRQRRKYVYSGIMTFVAALFVSVWLLLPRERINSIAVLPLENLTGNPEEEYFVEGMHEALVAEISKISALTVISRTSTMSYKQTHKPLREIARELQVDGVIEGSVLREGNQVRITVQLIQGPTDKHLWAKSFDRDMRGILALQSDVAQAIASELKVKLTTQEKERLRTIPTVNPIAHEAYLKGKYFYNKFTPESLRRGIEEFQRAIAIDSNFALAYAGLADAYAMSALSHGSLLPQDAFPRAREAAMKALVIDSNLASAHASIALAENFYFWDWATCEREIKRAIELDPNNAQAHETYYYFLDLTSRKQEGLDEIRRAQKLDPLSLIINSDVGAALTFVGRYEEAVKQHQEIFRMEPNFPPNLWALGHSYFLQEKYEEAINWFEKAYVASGEHSFWLGPLGVAYAFGGKIDKARDAMTKMSKEYEHKENISPTWIAGIHEALQENDEALLWLGRAIEQHDVQAPYYQLYNLFRRIRSDARFEAIIKQMNLRGAGATSRK